MLLPKASAGRELTEKLNNYGRVLGDFVAIKTWSPYPASFNLQAEFSMEFG